MNKQIKPGRMVDLQNFKMASYQIHTNCKGEKNNLTVKNLGKKGFG